MKFLPVIEETPKSNLPVVQATMINKSMDAGKQQVPALQL
jgi:hypothetical protein